MARFSAHPWHNPITELGRKRHRLPLPNVGQCRLRLDVVLIRNRLGIAQGPGARFAVGLHTDFGCHKPPQ
jgi:hypothetical protein